MAKSGAFSSLVACKFSDVNPLNSEHKTLNRKEEMGPWRFELQTFRLSVERSSRAELRARGLQVSCEKIGYD